jgi:hypothetical protein
VPIFLPSAERSRMSSRRFIRVSSDLTGTSPSLGRRPARRRSGQPAVECVQVRAPEEPVSRHRLLRAIGLLTVTNRLRSRRPFSRRSSIRSGAARSRSIEESRPGLGLPSCAAERTAARSPCARTGRRTTFVTLPRVAEASIRLLAKRLPGSSPGEAPSGGLGIRRGHPRRTRRSPRWRCCRPRTS